MDTCEIKCTHCEELNSEIKRICAFLKKCKKTKKPQKTPKTGWEVKMKWTTEWSLEIENDNNEFDLAAGELSYSH